MDENEPLPPGQRRPSRYAEQVRRDVAQIIQMESLSLPPPLATKAGTRPIISVTDVDLSVDFRNASVSVSTLGDDSELKACVSWLQKCRREIRHHLAKKMRSQKVVPELHFRVSNVPKALDTILLLDRLERERLASSKAVTKDTRDEETVESMIDDLEIEGPIDSTDVFTQTGSEDRGTALDASARLERGISEEITTSVSPKKGVSNKSTVGGKPRPKGRSKSHQSQKKELDLGYRSYIDSETPELERWLKSEGNETWKDPLDRLREAALRGSSQAAKGEWSEGRREPSDGRFDPEMEIEEIEAWLAAVDGVGVKDSLNAELESDQSCKHGQDADEDDDNDVSNRD